MISRYSSLLSAAILGILFLTMPLKAFAGETQYHTIQIGTFPTLATAEPLYNHLSLYLPDNATSYLRIEKIGRFFSVRLGRAERLEDIQELLARARESRPDAYILRAFVKEERIQRMVGMTAAASPAPLPQPAEENPEPMVAPEITAAPSSSPPPRPTPPRKTTRTKSSDEFYTLQLISQPSLNTALEAWTELVEKIPMSDRAHLRIEKIGAFHTIRLGKFDHQKDAEDLAGRLKTNGLRPLVLSAWIKQERIVKMWQEGDFETPSPPVAPPKPPEPKPVPRLPAVTPPPAITPPPTITPPPASPIAKEEDTAEKAPAEITETAPAPEEEAEEPEEPEEAPPAEEPVKKEKEKVTFEFLAEMSTDNQGKSIVFPSHIFTDPKNEEIYVVNGGENKIVVYDRNYFPASSFGKGRDIDKAEGGLVTEDGRIFITQRNGTTSRARLTIMSPAFMVLNEIPLADMEGAEKFLPLQVAIGKDKKIYIAGNYGNGVLVLTEKGEFSHWLKVLDEKYDKMYKKTNPKGGKPVPILDIKTDSAGNLYLLSEETSQVYVHSPDEKMLFAFGTKGGSSGKMSRPKNMAIDDEKNCIYIVDYMRHTILIFDLNGTYHYEFGGQGWGPGWFNFPIAVALDRRGTLLVADFFNNRIQALNVSPPSPLPERDPSVWH